MHFGHHVLEDLLDVVAGVGGDLGVVAIIVLGELGCRVVVDLAREVALVAHERDHYALGTRLQQVLVPTRNLLKCFCATQVEYQECSGCSFEE